MSSKLYFLANSEFASARSPDPPALEPCVGCRVSALSLSCAASRESLGVRARYYALSPSVRSARADAVRGPPASRRPAFVRAPLHLSGPRAASRPAPACIRAGRTDAVRGPPRASRQALGGRRRARNCWKQLCRLHWPYCPRRHGGGSRRGCVTPQPITNFSDRPELCTTALCPGLLAELPFAALLETSVLQTASKAPPPKLSQTTWNTIPTMLRF